MTNVKVILAGLEAYGTMWDGIDMMAGEFTCSRFIVGETLTYRLIVVQARSVLPSMLPRNCPRRYATIRYLPVQRNDIANELRPLPLPFISSLLHTVAYTNPSSSPLIHFGFLCINVIHVSRNEDLCHESQTASSIVDDRHLNLDPLTRASRDWRSESTFSGTVYRCRARIFSQLTAKLACKASQGPLRSQSEH